MNAPKKKTSKSPVFPLERVHDLASKRMLIAYGPKATRDADTYFGGADGLARVLEQLTLEEFNKTQTNNLPAAFACADVYKICLDEDMNKVQLDLNDMDQAEYYLKILIEDDKIVICLSGHLSS